MTALNLQCHVLRLCELAPPVAGESQEVGFSQPKVHSFTQPRKGFGKTAVPRFLKDAKMLPFHCIRLPQNITFLNWCDSYIYYIATLRGGTGGAELKPGKQTSIRLPKTDFYSIFLLKLHYKALKNFGNFCKAQCFIIFLGISSLLDLVTESHL